MKTLEDSKIEEKPNRLLHAVYRYGIVAIEREGCPAAVALSPDVYEALLSDKAAFESEDTAGDERDAMK